MAALSIEQKLDYLNVLFPANQTKPQLIHRNIDIIFGLGYGWYDFERKFDMSLYNLSVPYHLEKTFKDDLGKRAVRYSAGMQYLLNDNWSVRFMARYVDFTRSDIINGMTELSLGLRYMF